MANKYRQSKLRCSNCGVPFEEGDQIEVWTVGEIVSGAFVETFASDMSHYEGCDS